jgi:hypothetical protein
VTHPRGANRPAAIEEHPKLTSPLSEVQILPTQMDLPVEWRQTSKPPPFPSDAAPRIPMQDGASIIPMAVLVVAGLGLAVGLIFELDRVFRGDTDRSLKRSFSLSRLSLWSVDTC